MQISPDPYVIGVLCALAATILFAITNVIYRKIDNEISVLDIVITRIWVSLPLAYLFAVGTTGTIFVSVPPESMFLLTLSIIFGIVIGDTTYYFSQKRIGVARAFPIVMSYPLVVYLMAALFLDESIILQRMIGVIIVVLGVAMIARSEHADDNVQNERWTVRDRKIGFVFAFMTIIMWAASDVIFQFSVTSVGAAEANYFRILIASIIFVPIFIFSLRGGRRLPSRRISGIAMVTGLLGFGLSLIFYSYAIKLVGATITSVLTASAPVITAPLSIIYLREDVNKIVGIGTILTIIGILLVVIMF